MNRLVMKQRKKGKEVEICVAEKLKIGYDYRRDSSVNNNSNTEEYFYDC